MTPTTLLLIAAIVLLFGLISGRIERSFLTPPMIFVGVGILLCPSILGVVHVDRQSAVIHAMAELTLIIVLFTDAARIRIDLLRRNLAVPLPKAASVGMRRALSSATSRSASSGRKT